VTPEQIEETRLELQAIKGLDAETELANILSAEYINTANREIQHRQATGTTNWVGGECPACKTGEGEDRNIDTVRNAYLLLSFLS
jgi:hypothetical protein